MIRWVRNLFGIIVLTGGVALLVWLVASATAAVTVLAGAIAAWYLAIGGLRAASEQFGPSSSSDAGEVARLLRLPTAMCKGGFVIVAAATLAGCAWLLLRPL